MDRRNQHEKSVRYSWLISYITILLIPVFITGSLFVGVERIVNSKISSMNESILYQTKGILDNMFEAIYKGTFQIQMSGEINNVLSGGKQLDPDDYYHIYELKKFITQYTTHNDYVDDVIVYLDDSGYCVSSKSSYGPELFAEMLHQYRLSTQEWEYLKSRSGPGFYILEREKEQTGVVIYAASLPMGTAATRKGMILVIPKDKYFRQRINQDTGNMSKAIYLLNDGCIMPMGDVPEWMDTRLVGSFQGKRGNLSGSSDKKILSSAINSDVTDMEYIVVERYSEVYKELRIIRFSLLGSITFSMTLGIFLAMYFTRKNYVPMKELITSIMGNSEVQKVSDVNEYIFLSNAITKVINNKQEIERQLSLIKLLRGQDVPAIKKNFLAAETYLVVAIAIEDAMGFFGEQELVPDSHRLLPFVVSNCSRDFFEGRAICSDVVELDRYLVQIVCFQEKYDTSLKETVWQVLADIHQFFNDTMKIKLSIAMGGFCHSTDSLADSYEKAKEALEYRIVMGNNVLIDSYQLTGFALSYNYSIEIEKDIINSLKHGNFEQSRDMVFQVIDENLNSGMISAQLARCMLFDLVGTVIKALSLTRLDSNFLGQLNLIERLLQCETFEQMKDELSDILKKVCDYINKDMDHPNQKLFERMTAYVEHHYMEPDLNVSMLAAELFVSKTFLVKLFKENTGLTPLDYINRLRCERALIMMGTSDKTIEEISFRVGYSSSHTFIRIFKKLYGKTPGVYRTILLQEQLEKNKE